MPPAAVTRGEIRINAPLSHQRALKNSPARYKLGRSGRRGGKTDLAGNCLTLGHGPLVPTEETTPNAQADGVPAVRMRPMYLGALDGGRMLWLARDYKQAGAIWDKWLLPLFTNRPGIKINEQKKQITFPGTGVILLRSAENLDAIRGDSFDGAVIDEGAFIDLEYAWLSVILPALTDYDGWAIVISSPRLGSYFNQMCEEEVESKREGAAQALVEQYAEFAQFSWRTMDNKALPLKARERLYRMYPAGSTDLEQELNAALLTEHGTLFAKAMFQHTFERAGYFKETRTWGMVCSSLTGDHGLVPFREIVVLADLAASVKQSADYTVLKVAGVTDEIDGAVRVAILDVIRRRIEGPDQIALLADTVRRWRPSKLLVETVGYQLTAVQHLRRNPACRHTSIEEVRPDKDKRSRAVPWAAMLGRGEAFFPAKGAAWLADYVPEHVKFSGDGKGHDDQVDTGSMLAAYLVGGSAEGLAAEGNY